MDLKLPAACVSIGPGPEAGREESQILHRDEAFSPAAARSLEELGRWFLNEPRKPCRMLWPVEGDTPEFLATRMTPLTNGNGHHSPAWRIEAVVLHGNPQVGAAPHLARLLQEDSWPAEKWDWSNGAPLVLHLAPPDPEVASKLKGFMQHEGRVPRMLVGGTAWEDDGPFELVSRKADKIEAAAESQEMEAQAVAEQEPAAAEAPAETEPPVNDPPIVESVAPIETSSPLDVAVEMQEPPPAEAATPMEVVEPLEAAVSLEAPAPLEAPVPIGPRGAEPYQPVERYLPIGVRLTRLALAAGALAAGVGLVAWFVFKGEKPPEGLRPDAAAVAAAKAEPTTPAPETPLNVAPPVVAKPRVPAEPTEMAVATPATSLPPRSDARVAELEHELQLLKDKLAGYERVLADKGLTGPGVEPSAELFKLYVEEVGRGTNFTTRDVVNLRVQNKAMAQRIESLRRDLEEARKSGPSRP